MLVDQKQHRHSDDSEPSAEDIEIDFLIQQLKRREEIIASLLSRVGGYSLRVDDDAAFTGFGVIDDAGTFLRDAERPRGRARKEKPLRSAVKAKPREGRARGGRSASPRRERGTRQQRK